MKSKKKDTKALGLQWAIRIGALLLALLMFASMFASLMY